MKRKILLLALFALSAPLSWAAPPAKTDDPTLFRFTNIVCRLHSSYGKYFMILRQYNHSIYEALDYLDEREVDYSNTVDANIQQSLNILLRHAYTIPIEELPSDKERAIADFETQSYLNCMKVME